MDEILLGQINDLAQDVFDSIHKSKPFIPGETPIPVTGKFFGVQEIASALKAAGEFWLTWVFATEDISKVEEKFGRSAIEGHRTRPDGSDLKWKQIGVNEITESRELPFFIQWLTEDHPSQDGKAVAAIEKITIADADHLSDSWFKTEILGGLNGADVEFVGSLVIDGARGIVAVHLT